MDKVTVDPRLPKSRIDAALALIAAGKVTDDYANLTDAEAIDVIMLSGIDELEANMVLAMARGESTGDVEEVVAAS